MLWFTFVIRTELEGAKLFPVRRFSQRSDCRCGLQSHWGAALSWTTPAEMYLNL